MRAFLLRPGIPGLFARAARGCRVLAAAVSARDPALRWLSYAWALGTGAVFVLGIFPHAMLVHGAVPDTRLSGDVAAHVVGQRAFLQDSWHWPLLKTTLLDWPRGISIAMTDSIPLVALPLKLFRVWLPPGFSAIQFWLAFSYLMQPVAAVFALRSAGETKLLPAIAVSLFAISMPSFLFRHPHAALSSHFVLLLALGSYFLTTRGQHGRRWIPPVLLPASLLIHPYIAAMTLAVLAAAPLTLALRRDKRWRQSALVVALGVLVTACLAPCLGYAAADPSGGFGLDSMNALSPFFPNYSRYLGRHLAFLDPTGSQYEGYQFLGLGLLVLLSVFLVTALFSTEVRFLRRHFGMALACLALTALALSNVVYVGTHRYLVLGHVPPFMHQLRSSGRLFWPVAYMVLIGSVAGVSRLVPAPAAPAILLGLGLLQLLDASDMRRTVARDLRAHEPTPIDPRRLPELLAGNSRLTLLPTFGCGADTRAPEFMQLLLASSTFRMQANTMYVARFAALPDCRDNASARRPLLDGELRVFLPLDARTGPSLVPDGARNCRMLDIVAVCTLRERPLQGLPPVVVPTAPLGVDLPTGTSATVALLGPGWYMPEPDGTWTIGKTASLEITFGPPPSGAVRLRARMRGFTGVNGTFQQVAVSVNGHRTATWQVPNGEESDQQLVVPRDQLAEGPQEVRFDVGQPLRPSERNVNSDSRQLGIFLEKIRFDDIKS